MIKDINIPNYIRGGIGHNHVGFPQRYTLMAGDTETCHGDVFTLQLNITEPKIYWVSPDNVLDVFLKQTFEYCQSGHLNVIFFHNLHYDLPVLLMQYADSFKKDFAKIEHRGYLIDLYSGKQFFAFIKHNKTRLSIFDSMAFYPLSLKKLCIKLKLSSQKMRAPCGLGDDLYCEDDKYFVQYALNDVVCELDLAKHIIDLHREYNIRVSVSLPQFASRVFKHQFIRDGDVLQFPLNAKLLKIAIHSYHGGRNGLFIDAGDYRQTIYKYDYISAYSKAMTELPNFMSGQWVFVDSFKPQYEGIYCIDGFAKQCKYPAIPRIDNRLFYYSDEPFADVCLTSYELRESIRADEIILSKCWGYVWMPETHDYNPIKNYALHWFNLKSQTDKDDPRYEFYKLMNNSLYGKFIQNQPEDADRRMHITIDKNGVQRKDKKFIAGGLFNPCIASLITGFVRAKLHQDLHNYNALDCSTDSFTSYEYLPETVNNKTLGGIKLEHTLDRMVFIRPKFYLGYANNDLKTYATHGYQGSIKDIERMLQRHEPEYVLRDYIVPIRQALTQHIKPLGNIDKIMSIKANLFNAEDL